MEVDMITSSAVPANSFKIRYTICRSEGSLFWKSFEMPKNNVVASFVGNFSPVKSKTAILVSSVRHFRGDIGEELNNRAVPMSAVSSSRSYRSQFRALSPTILENRSPIQLHHYLISIFIFLNVAHLCNAAGRLGCGQ